MDKRRRQRADTGLERDLTLENVQQSLREREAKTREKLDETESEVAERVDDSRADREQWLRDQLSEDREALGPRDPEGG